MFTIYKLRVRKSPKDIPSASLRRRIDRIKEGFGDVRKQANIVNYLLLI